jgi:pimeloyl-ACP methyl ester carboxylesterase
MTVFLVAHGAWSAGWAWQKMRPLLDTDGDHFVTPSYTGLGERAHLANPSIDLETHIEDILGVLEYEDLADVILIGHSYGGMVATGVADRARHRIRRLVYLDAFVPVDGQNLVDLLPPGRGPSMRNDARLHGDGWQVPPSPLPLDTPPEDRAWIVPRRKAQSLACFAMPLRLRGGEPTLPRTYVYCTTVGPDDVFRQFAERARRESWDYRELATSHNPHITRPEALAALLRDVAAMSALPSR